MLARPSPSKSRTIGPYELVVELAKSPLGPLWVATTESGSGLEPRQLRRVPVGPRTSEADIARLRESARWSQALSSEHALRVLDIVNADGELALVGSYLPCETLRSLLRLSNFKRQPVPVPVALRIVLDICEALLEAEVRAVSATQGPDFHCGGLLPDSVLVGTDGKARLNDLGIAAVWRTVPGVAEHAEVTAYSAPEQLEGGLLDSRTDVFIVGILLWEMLTGGKRLFVGSSHRAVAEKVREHPIPELIEPGITPAIQEVVSKMLERDPRRRYRSISDLKATLEALDPSLVAPAIELSDFVTTFAHNPLSSRERVLERALNRPSPSMPAAAPAVTGPPAARLEPSAAALPAAPPRPPPGPSEPASEARTAAPSPAQAPHISSAGRPEIARGVARPLPLPAQAKLGTRISAPDGMLPPPLPPPPLEPAPSAPSASDELDENDGSSVRAADILRALAVEDAAPPSDEMPTLRPKQEQLRPVPAAPAAPPPLPSEARVAMETLPGHADPAAGLAPDARPPLQTIPGHAPPVTRASAPSFSEAEFPGRDSTPFDGTDSALRASDALRSTTPLTPAVAAAPTASATASDAAVTGLPARQSSFGARRWPVALTAAIAGAALLLTLVFVFLGQKSDSAQDEPRAAQHSPAASDRRSGKQNGNDNATAPAAATSVHENESTHDEPDATPGDTPTDAPEPEPESDSPKQAATGPSPPPATPAPRAARPSAPARATPPRTRASTPQGSSQLRAKRTFIPSGI